MKIGACSIACEKCPSMVQNKCPSGQHRCMPKENEFCQIATCAYYKGVKLCLNALVSRHGPIDCVWLIEYDRV